MKCPWIARVLFLSALVAGSAIAAESTPTTAPEAGFPWSGRHAWSLYMPGYHPYSCPVRDHWQSYCSERECDPDSLGGHLANLVPHLGTNCRCGRRATRGNCGTCRSGNCGGGSSSFEHRPTPLAPAPDTAPRFHATQPTNTAQPANAAQPKAPRELTEVEADDVAQPELKPVVVEPKEPASKLRADANRPVESRAKELQDAPTVDPNIAPEDQRVAPTKEPSAPPTKALPINELPKRVGQRPVRVIEASAPRLK